MPPAQRASRRRCTDTYLVAVLTVAHAGNAAAPAEQRVDLLWYGPSIGRMPDRFASQPGRHRPRQADTAGAPAGQLRRIPCPVPPARAQRRPRTPDPGRPGEQALRQQTLLRRGPSLGMG